MTAGRLDLPGDLSGQVYILYNRARSRFAITDDTQLSQRFALRVAALLEKHGLTVCSPNGESHQPGSEIDLLSREVNTIRWTVIVLSPEFLKGSWNIYKSVPLLKQQLTERSCRDNAICLALGINRNVIPNELSSLKVINFNKNFEDDVESWTAFQRHFVTPAFHGNPWKVPACGAQLDTRQDKMSLHSGTSTRSILDYKARRIDLPTERSLGSWFHPSLPHLSSPPLSPPTVGRDVQQNSPGQLPVSNVNAPARETRDTAPYSPDGHPPCRFAHLYQPLPPTHNRLPRTGHWSKTEADSHDRSPENFRLGCDIAGQQPIISQASQTRSDPLDGCQMGSCDQLMDISRQPIHDTEELRNDALGNAPQRQTSDLVSRVKNSSVSLSDNTGLSHSCKRPDSKITDVQRVERYGHTTQSNPRESIYIRPRRTFSSSLRRTFAYTDHSIERLEKRQRSPASKVDVASFDTVDKEYGAQGSLNILETQFNDDLSKGRESFINSAASYAVPRVHITYHSSDEAVHSHFNDSLKETSKSFQSDFEEREKRFHSKQESASRCPCHLRYQESVSPSVTNTATVNQKRYYSQNVSVARGHFSGSQSRQSFPQTFRDKDVTDSKRNRNSQHSSLSCHDTSPLNSSPASFSSLSPIRPRHTVQRINEFPRASSPLSMMDSYLHDDSLLHGVPSGSYLQEELQRSPVASISESPPKRLQDSSELCSSPVLPDLDRSDLSADLTYIHSRLEEHSRSLLDHSSRLEEIISKASKAIEVRRSFNSSLSDANVDKSKNGSDCIPLDDEVYFSLPPLRDCKMAVPSRSEDSPTGHSASLKEESRTPRAFSKGVQKLKQLTEKSASESKTTDSKDDFFKEADNDININYVFRPLSLDASLSFLKEQKFNLVRKSNVPTTFPEKPASELDVNNLNERHTKLAVKTSEHSLSYEDVSRETCASVFTEDNYTGVLVSHDTHPDVSVNSLALYDHDKSHPVVSAKPSSSQITATETTECPSIADSGVFDKSVESVHSIFLGAPRKHPSKYNRVSDAFGRVNGTGFEDDAGDWCARRKTDSSSTDPLLVEEKHRFGPTSIHQITPANWDKDTQFLRQSSNTSAATKDTCEAIQLTPTPDKNVSQQLSEPCDSESGHQSPASVNSVTFRLKNDNLELSKESETDMFESSAHAFSINVSPRDTVDFLSNTNINIGDKPFPSVNTQQMSCDSEVEACDTVSVSPNNGAQTVGCVAVSPDAQVQVRDILFVSRDNSVLTCDTEAVSPDSDFQTSNTVNVSPDVEAQVCDAVSVSPDTETQTCNTATVSPDVDVQVCDAVPDSQDTDAQTCDTVSVSPDVEVQVCDAVPEFLDTDALTCNTVTVSLVVEVQVCDSVPDSQDTDAQTCDTVNVSPDVEVQVCDAVPEFLDTDTLTCNIVTVSPDVKVQVCDSVPDSQGTDAQACDTVSVSPGVEVQVCDAVHESLDTDAQTCDTVTVSPDVEVQVCDAVPEFLDTDALTCNIVTVSPDVEVQVCDSVPDSQGTDAQTCDTVNVSPDVEVQVCDAVPDFLDTDALTCNTVTVSPDVKVQVCDSVPDSQGTDAQTCNTVSVSPGVEVQVCDAVHESLDTDAQTCDTVTVSPDVEVQVCDAVPEFLDTDALTCNIVTVSPDVEVQVCDSVPDSQGTDAQTCDTVNVSPDVEVQVCDAVPDFLDTDALTCNTVTVSPDVKVQVCDSVPDSQGTDAQTCNTVSVSPGVEVQVCDAVHESLDTDAQTCDIESVTDARTCDTVNVSPDVEVQVCDTMLDSQGTGAQTCDIESVSPDVEVQVCDAMSYSQDTDAQICDTVTVSPNVEVQVCDALPDSADTDTHSCDTLTVSPDVEVQVYNAVSDSPDTNTKTYDTVTVSTDGEVQVCDTDAHTGNAVTVSTDIEVQACHAVPDSPDTDTETCDAVTVSPDVKAQVCEGVCDSQATDTQNSDTASVSPNVEIQFCDAVPVSPDNDAQNCNTVTVSTDVEVQVCEAVSHSPDTDAQTCDTGTVSPDTEVEVYDTLAVSHDTSMLTCDTEPLSSAIGLEVGGTVPTLVIASHALDTPGDALDIVSDAPEELVTGSHVPDDFVTDSQTSDATVRASNAPDATVRASNAPDATVRASHVPDALGRASHAADTLVTVSHAPDALRRASYAADTLVTVSHAPDALRRASYAADTLVTVSHAPDALRRASYAADTLVTVSHAPDALRRASYAADTLVTVSHAPDALYTASHELSDGDKCQISDAVICECNTVEHENQDQINQSSAFHVSCAVDYDAQTLGQAVDEYNESRCHIPDDFKGSCSMLDAVHCECHMHEAIGSGISVAMHRDDHPVTNPADVAHRDNYRSSVGDDSYEETDCDLLGQTQFDSTADCEPESSEYLGYKHDSPDRERYSGGGALDSAFFPHEFSDCVRDSFDSLGPDRQRDDLLDRGGHSPDLLDCGHHLHDPGDCGRDSPDSLDAERDLDYLVEGTRHSPDSLDMGHHSYDSEREVNTYNPLHDSAGSQDSTWHMSDSLGAGLHRDSPDCEVNTFDSLHYAPDSPVSQDCVRPVSDSLDRKHHSDDPPCEVNTFDSLHYVLDSAVSQNCTPHMVDSTGCERLSHDSSEDNDDFICHTTNSPEFRPESPDSLDCQNPSTDHLSSNSLSSDFSGSERQSSDLADFELYFTEPADTTCLSGRHPNVDSVKDIPDKSDTEENDRQATYTCDVDCPPNKVSESKSPACTSLIVSIDRPLPRELLLHRIVLPSARHNYFDYFRFFGRRPLYNNLLESQILGGNTNFLSLAHFHVSQDLQTQGVTRSISEPCLLTSSNYESNDEQSLVPVNQFRALHRRTVSNVEDYQSAVSSITSRQGASRGSSRTRFALCRLMCHLLTRPEQFYT